MKRKRQTNLLSFLGKPDYSIPRFFNLNTDHSASFTNDKPSESEIYEVKWKDHCTLRMSSSLSSSQVYIPIIHATYPMPYLKSHLQKCIRRCRTELAVKTALYMINLDAKEVYHHISHPSYCVDFRLLWLRTRSFIEKLSLLLYFSW
jgi:hypothetical protein